MYQTDTILLFFLISGNFLFISIYIYCSYANLIYYEIFVKF